MWQNLSKDSSIRMIYQDWKTSARKSNKVGRRNTKVTITKLLKSFNLEKLTKTRPARLINDISKNQIWMR